MLKVVLCANYLKRTTRAFQKKRKTYEERLLELELMTLQLVVQERRKQGDAIEMFKYLRGFLDVDEETLFSVYGQHPYADNHSPSTLIHAINSPAYKT